MSDKPEVVEFKTTDSPVADGRGVLHAADKEVLEAAKTGKGLIELTPDKLQQLVQAAGRAAEAAEKDIKALITPERAAFVRKLRVDEGYSWRAVAAACYEEFKGDWHPPSNQIWGMALCEAAANYFDENYMAEPWNGEPDL